MHITWLIPGAVQIPVALTWAVLVNTRKVYHEKELLEESVATAKAAAASASAHHDTGSGPLSALSVINEAAVAAKAEAPEGTLHRPVLKPGEKEAKADKKGPKRAAKPAAASCSEMMRLWSGLPKRLRVVKFVSPVGKVRLVS